ncbi:ParA family protein [Bifidobacterium xylocopae]|uniref:Chromosome partitioning protein ParA n=1 Tax=Bifidobacterium xylocopae TaxID=2493119 RepID=A0A366KBK8_9BIFI|nr:ParA family protein [Bifidobacterium xylocopae]RBP98757.1 chromosome partitioning protein ParA [Bifidobacterium xylocopae]
MIITIANAKGGVAKTTSAIYLACAASKDDQQVTVLDADIQSSASLWADTAETETPLPFRVDAANLSTFNRLHPSAADWVIVDAAPADKIMTAAIGVSDFVIIPTSDSPMDLQQVWAMISAIPEDTPTAVLIAKAQPRTTAFHETVEALKGQGVMTLEEHKEAGTIANVMRFSTAIPLRQDIKKALGTTPPHLYEYTELYLETLQIKEYLGL